MLRSIHKGKPPNVWQGRRNYPRGRGGRFPPPKTLNCKWCESTFNLVKSSNNFSTYTAMPNGKQGTTGNKMQGHHGRQGSQVLDFFLTTYPPYWHFLWLTKRLQFLTTYPPILVNLVRLWTTLGYPFWGWDLYKIYVLPPDFQTFRRLWTDLGENLLA